jgi:hypothetical protein
LVRTLHRAAGSLSKHLGSQAIRSARISIRVNLNIPNALLTTNAENATDFSFLNECSDQWKKRNVEYLLFVVHVHEDIRERLCVCYCMFMQLVMYSTQHVWNGFAKVSLLEYFLSTELHISHIKNIQRNFFIIKKS